MATVRIPSPKVRMPGAGKIKMPSAPKPKLGKLSTGKSNSLGMRSYLASSKGNLF